jgi:uncharacterized membrane protein
MKKEEFIHIHKLHPVARAKTNTGQRMADILAKYIGSWRFVIAFIVLLIFWIAVNAYFVISYELGDPFDPYPFVFLNLILSCLAAIQAPIILMSQNRQEEKERIKIDYDYKVNRKAEREIEEIREQLDRIENKINKR